MDSLLDVLTADVPEDAPALRAPGEPPADYDRRGFVEAVWKVGNYLRRLGTHEGATVGVVPCTSAAVPLAILGGSLNGATIHLDPPRDVDAKLLVAPGDQIAAYDLPPGAQRVAHSGSVDDPSVHALVEGVWSENPTFPRDRVFVASSSLRDRDGRTDHASILERVETLLDDEPLTAGMEVVVRSQFDHTGAVLAGLFAPLLVGATIRLVDGPGGEIGDVALVEGAAETPEPETIRTDRV